MGNIIENLSQASELTHKRRSELERKRANMNQIFETLAQIKQVKVMDTLNLIIRQNSSIFENVIPLLEQLKDDKLSKEMKKSIEKTAQKALEVLYDVMILFLAFVFYLNCFTHNKLIIS
jgi:hypothetical protein